MPSTTSQIASAFRFTLFALSFAARCTASAVLFPVRPLLAARQEEAEREANADAVEERRHRIKLQREDVKRCLEENHRMRCELRSHLEKLDQQHREKIAKVERHYEEVERHYEEVERHYEEVERQRKAEAKRKHQVEEAERQRLEKIAAEKARRAALTPGQRMAENCHKFAFLSHALKDNVFAWVYIDGCLVKYKITLEYIAKLYNTKVSALIEYFENSENVECGCRCNRECKCYFAYDVNSNLSDIYKRKMLPTKNYTDKSVFVQCDCMWLHDYGCRCDYGDRIYNYSWIPGRESEKPDSSVESIYPGYKQQ